MIQAWFKRLQGSRDPPETKSVRSKPVKDTLAREELITDEMISELENYQSKIKKLFP